MLRAHRAGDGAISSDLLVVTGGAVTLQIQKFRTQQAHPFSPQSYGLLGFGQRRDIGADFDPLTVAGTGCQSGLLQILLLTLTLLLTLPVELLDALRVRLQMQQPRIGIE